MGRKTLVNGSSALKEKKYNVITIEATKKPENVMLRVAAYARVSSDSADQENSFGAQTRYYTQFITENQKWQFVDIYADEGITGTSMEKRDDFKRLIADCRRGLIDKVLVKSISRFARNTTECLSVTRELKQLGIGVVFEKEGIDTSAVSSELMTTVFASFAQRESESISSNARLGFQMRLKNKTYIPAYLPYGFIRQDNQIIPHPEQAPIIRRIFDEYLSGISVEAIASGLRKDNIPCKSGKVAWDSTAIRYIITNEKYKGDSLWQKYYTTDTLPFVCKRNRGERDAFYAQGTHDGIVSEETFQKANDLMQERAKKVTLASHEPYPFRQKLYCGCCGSVFRRKVVRNKVYWSCIGRDKKRVDNCTVTPVAEAEVEAAFPRLYYNLKHHDILSQMLADLTLVQERRMLWREDVIALNKKISDLSSQNQMMASLHTQGLIDPDIFIAKSNELEHQIRATKLQKERILAETADSTIPQTRELIEVLDSGPELMETFEPELFEQIIDRITVEDNEHIRFRLKNGLELRETIERTVR